MSREPLLSLLRTVEEQNEMARAAVTGLTALLHECVMALSTVPSQNYVGPDGTRQDTQELSARVEAVLAELRGPVNARVPTTAR